MKKFYNRKQELKNLNQHYKIAGRNLIVETIMGRRRIGKTELVKKYMEKKSAVYFYVTKKSSQIILNDFTDTLREQFPVVPARLNSFEDFFNLLFELSRKKRIIVVFDEFQNFQDIDLAVS